jgi:hypothetical protein
MARHAQRPADGRWSLLQVRTAAGVTEAIARSAHRSGLIDTTALTGTDVVTLRVAAALLTAPTAFDGRSRTQQEEQVARRNRMAMFQAREMIQAGARDGYLLVFPDEAMTAEDDLALIGVIRKRPTQAALVLPVGRWLAEMPATSAAS